MSCAQKPQHHHQKRQKKRACQRKNSRHRKKRRNRLRQEARNLLFRLRKTMDHQFPDLYDKLEAIPDCRTQPRYRLVELLVAGLAMFLFKKGSRNAMNNEREDPRFRAQYERLFNVRLPHMDTVEDVLEVLDAQQFETLKAELIKGVLAQKRLRRYRLFGQYYQVVLDATHVMDVPEGHCPSCLQQTLKNGKIRYFHNVLEAKLVGANGFCLSLATEWVENTGEYEKQDCELKAFTRLAPKLKHYYPRLPICVVADGLYPNQTVFRLCQTYGWAWIMTLKAGNLPSVWRAGRHRQGATRCRSRWERIWAHGQEIIRCYEWQTHLSYQGFTVHWWECTERIVGQRWTRFVYLTNLANVRYQTMLELTESGRLRWKIENEGFDIQKHHGYGLGHQFSRCSMLAMKNYYQLMQIAHLINQFFELGSLLTAVRGPKESLAHIWLCLLGELRHEALDFAVLAALRARRIRIHYD
jgi:hypothetical protein